MTRRQRQKLDRLILDFALTFYSEGMEADDPSKATMRKQKTAHRRLTRYLDSLTT